MPLICARQRSSFNEKGSSDSELPGCFIDERLVFAVQLHTADMGRPVTQRCPGVAASEVGGHVCRQITGLRNVFAGEPYAVVVDCCGPVVTPSRTCTHGRIAGEAV